MYIYIYVYIPSPQIKPNSYNIVERHRLVAYQWTRQCLGHLCPMKIYSKIPLVVLLPLDSAV